MTRSQIDKAVERNQPFYLDMADGLKYFAPHRDYISFPPMGAYVVVYDEDSAAVLPLLTMTGLTYETQHLRVEAEA